VPAAQEGTHEGGSPCLSFGEGSPLVVLPGIGMTNSNPTGIQRWGEVRLLLLPDGVPLRYTYECERRELSCTKYVIVRKQGEIVIESSSGTTSQL